MEMDLPHYSDANFTMRLSYGQVGGYMIGGFNSGYYTTAESIVEKFKQANKVADYKAEPIMMKLLSSNDYGPYADKTSGQLQLCSSLITILQVVTLVHQCLTAKANLLVLLSMEIGIV